MGVSIFQKLVVAACLVIALEAFGGHQQGNAFISFTIRNANRRVPWVLRVAPSQDPSDPLASQKKGMFSPSFHELQPAAPRKQVKTPLPRKKQHTPQPNTQSNTIDATADGNPLGEHVAPTGEKPVDYALHEADLPSEEGPLLDEMEEVGYAADAKGATAQGKDISLDSSNEGSVDVKEFVKPQSPYINWKPPKEAIVGRRNNEIGTRRSKVAPKSDTKFRKSTKEHQFEAAVNVPLDEYATQEEEITELGEKDDVPLEEHETLEDKVTELDEQYDDTMGGIDALQDDANTQINDAIAPQEGDVAFDNETMQRDTEFMQMAIDLAMIDGGERSERSAYPNPTVGAVLVHKNRVLGKGHSDFQTEAIRSCLEDAGLCVTALADWHIEWDSTLMAENGVLSESTLYVTLEPSTRRRGTMSPPIVNLVRQTGVARVVIGCPSPVPEKAMKGAEVLHNAGIDVSIGEVFQDQCEELIADFSVLATGKLQRMARKHYQLFGRPLGFLHCSVIDSDNVEAFARQGNAFGTSFGGNKLSFRNFGAYELAPPPELIFADEGEGQYDDDDLAMIDFEDEVSQGDMATASPMMPWYEQCDAVVATFPRKGNGPTDNDTISARLNGLKWLATHGNALPAGVERILVMDATELRNLPLKNNDPNLPSGVDVDSFWKTTRRKPTRVLLRRGINEAARAAATASKLAAERAAEAAAAAAVAIESGEASRAAKAALEYQAAAQASHDIIHRELEVSQAVRRQLEEFGVIVETLEGGEPIDVMNHLGERHGLYSVVWRAGCWGNRGVQAVLAGAFQWVSAHLAVDAVGGRFWQLMMAENAVQAACGPRAKVKVFADQEDISMEYCDDVDCVKLVDGVRPIRHVRLDCRVALVDEDRPREFSVAKTAKLDRKKLVEEAPWFL